MKRRIRFTVLLFAALLCTALAGCAALSNIPTKAAEPKTKESRQSERDNTDKEGSGREKEASDAPDKPAETKPAGTQEDPEGKQTAPEKETKKESKILHIITRKKTGRSITGSNAVTKGTGFCHRKIPNGGSSRTTTRRGVNSR